MAATEEIEKEILAEMAANPVPYAAGQVNDVITIDGETRMISVPASEIFFGVESDKDVERKHFRCPKVVGDGIDLSKHQIYISYITSDSAGKTFSGNAGLYLCEDVATDGDDITFSWQLSGNVFASAGFIAFKVLAAKTDGENVQTRWNTVPAIGTVLMTVPDGMDIGEAYPDIVTQLLERMASVEKIATEEAMQGYVNTYLEAHPGEIDETLTDPKKAAPASVVGELKGDIVSISDGNAQIIDGEFFKLLPEWEQGAITSSGLQSNEYWVRSKEHIASDFVFINPNGKYKWEIVRFRNGEFNTYMDIGTQQVSNHIYSDAFVKCTVQEGYTYKISARLIEDKKTTPSNFTGTSYSKITDAEKGITKLFQYRGYASPTKYERLTSKLVDDGVYQCSGDDFDDLPENRSYIIQVSAFSGNYKLQIAYPINETNVYHRVVHRTTFEVYRDWTAFVSIQNKLKTKKVAIIGDSRSTFRGTVPTGNAVYYPKTTGSILTDVNQMWWKRVLDYFGMTLTVNDSYSGGFVANKDGNNGANTLSSDVSINNLGTTAPNIIMIFAGVNDWNNNQVSIGSYDGSQEFPTDNSTFREAFAIMLKKVQNKFPSADIWLCTNPYSCPAGTGSTISNMPVPRTNTGVKLDTFNEAIREMAHLFGCRVIDFETCGVNYKNCKTYAKDYEDDHGLHFNAEGHALLADVAIKTLDAYYN